MVVDDAGELQRTSLPSGDRSPSIRVTGTWPGAVHVKLAVALVGASIVPDGADQKYAMEPGSAAVAVAARDSECPTVASEGEAATLVHAAQPGACAAPASLPKGVWAATHCRIMVT
jgi:hypothetical protein